MAEKIFTNIRLGLKVDTLENWGKSSLILKRGELAFATVAASAGLGLSEPVTMVKIGDGEHTFAELEYNFYAKASDVLAACKSEAALKTFINGVIADAGIATDEALTALSGRVTTAEGKITTLEGKMTTAEGKISANETAIADLEGLVGEKNVATQIQEAIAALNLATTYELKGEAAKVQTALDTHKTSNDKAVADNKAAIEAEVSRAQVAEKANADAITAIKDGTTIDSFADVETELAKKEASGAASQALADAKTYADGLNTAMDTRVKAVEGKAHTHTFVEAELNKIADGDVAKWNAAEQNAKDYTDSELERLVGETAVGVQITTAINDLDLANTYAAKSHKHVKADITDFAHSHAISEVTGLQDALDGKQAVGDYATKAEAQGYANAKDDAIAAALKAGQDAQADVDNLETYVGAIPDSYTETNVVAYINKKAEETLAAAQGGSSETAASVKQALDNYKSENNTKVNANTAAIEALEGLVGEDSVSTQINNALQVDGVEKYALATDLTAEVDRAKAAEKVNADAIAKLNADAETEGSVDYKVAQAIAGVMENPDETMNSIQELVTWTQEHAADALTMSNQVTANKNAIATLNGDATTAGSVDKKIADAIAAENLAQYATDTELSDVSSRVAAIEDDYLVAADKTELQNAINAKAAQTDLDALEGLVGETAVSEQISGAIADLKLAETYAAKVHTHVKADITDFAHTHEISEVNGLQTALDKKANDADLAAIAKTGSTDDLVQGELVLVFDCGDSTNI